MTENPDYAAAAALYQEQEGTIPHGHYLTENPHLAKGTKLGDEYRARLEALGIKDPLTAQAHIVRAEVERLYVDDPTTTRHPTWQEFNAFLRAVRVLCDIAAPVDTGEGQ